MFEWLKDVLLWVPQKVWELILSGLGAAFSAIPVPSWMSSLSTFGAGIPPGVGYFLHVMRVPEGLAMLVGAYTLRFVVRRIPVIG